LLEEMPKSFALSSNANANALEQPNERDEFATKACGNLATPRQVRPHSAIGRIISVPMPERERPTYDDIMRPSCCQFEHEVGHDWKYRSGSW
jgi:hypothetical protein